MDFDLDIIFVIKFCFVFGLFVIVPVWIFNLAPISFMYKILFTLAGAVGAFIALAGNSLRAGKYN